MKIKLLLVCLLVLAAGCDGARKKIESTQVTAWNEGFIVWECNGISSSYGCSSRNVSEQIDSLNEKMDALAKSLGYEFFSKNTERKEIHAHYEKVKK